MKKNLNEGKFDTGEKFKPTVQWISESYAKANKELFDGMLGDCIFEAKPITHNTRWLGSFRTQVNNPNLQLMVNVDTRRMYLRNRLNHTKIADIYKDNFVEMCKPTITLSTYYSGTEKSLYATLVHEMCHYYTYMYGICPKQAHGPEFRQIGSMAAYRSHGELTVQRIASAEQMEGYEVDDEIKKKQDAREAKKKLNADYYLVIDYDTLDNPSRLCDVRLINTKSVEVYRDVVTSANKRGWAVIHLLNRALTERLYDEGYNSAMRKYTYWPLKSNNPIVQAILSNCNNYNIEN